MTDNCLYQQTLHLLRLIVNTVQTHELRLGRNLLILVLRFLSSLSTGFFFLLLFVLRYHAVHRVQQRLFLDTQPL